ncbi:MAG: transglutaminase family protein [Microcystaceae cyanobacterium]
MPDETDLEVPISEKKALKKIINEFNIDQKNDREKLKQIESFFANHFGYSLKFEDDAGKPKSLTSFLLNNRSGHCEYFATATTLLLREVGIPSRYVTGYVVAEYSPLERLYLVRSRHAHAWTLAYIDGSWQEIDTTPSNWFSLEEQDLPQASWLSKLMGFIQFKISQGWQWSIHQPWFKYSGLLIPLFLILRWSKIRTKIRKLSQKSAKISAKISTDLSSPLYLVEQSLNKRGLWRSPSETFKQWFIRLKKEDQAVGTWEELLPILELYYRERFDPKGLTPSQHDQLVILVQAWLKK